MYHSPRELRQQRLRWLTRVVLAIVGFFVVGLFDHWVWLHATLPPKQMREMINGEEAVVMTIATEWLGTRDWYQMLRQAGHLPTWYIIAAAALFIDWRAARLARRAHQLIPSPHPPWRRAALLALAPTLAGLAAEMLRLLLRRHRPGALGIHQWSALWESRPPHGWGLPSSHAAVAFGGAFMLARLVPGVWPVPIAWAIACGVSRLLPGAHFASDVYLGAVVSSFTVAALLRSGRRGVGPLPGPLFTFS